MEVDVSKLSSVIKSYTQIIQEKVEAAVKDVVTEAERELIPIYIEGVKDVYRESVDEFYSSYSPSYYGRTQSLYGILEVEQSGSKVAIWFEPERMTGFRSGYRGEDGLYDLVFRRGYHGGAESGSYKGSGFYSHPSPGVPYWRKPYPSYTRWGRPAAVSTPPLDLFGDKREAYRTGEFLEYAMSFVKERIAAIKIDW